jgi:hypothetical protein
MNYFIFILGKVSDFIEKLNNDLAIKEPVNDFHKLPSQKYALSSMLLII